MIDAICKVCNKKFRYYKSSSKGIVCSRTCLSIYFKDRKFSSKTRNKIRKKAIKRWKNSKERLKQSNIMKQFCKHRDYCYNKNPNYKKGYTLEPSGRRKITLKNNNGGYRYKYDYQLIMEKHIGRELKSEEVIHHIDENVTNNNITNLKLLNNQSEHMKQHKRAKGKWK